MSFRKLLLTILILIWNIDVLKAQNSVFGVYDMGFSERYTPKKSLVANWKQAGPEKVKLQKIQLYEGLNCETPRTSPIKLKSNTTRKRFKVKNAGNYSFQILTIGKNGTRKISQCSKPIEVDTSPPLLATGLSFEREKEKKAYIQLKWKKSESPDLKKQAVVLYKDNKCQKRLGKPIMVALKKSKKYQLRKKSLSARSFNVKSFDKVNNHSLSRCHKSNKAKDRDLLRDMVVNLHFDGPPVINKRKIRARWKRVKSKHLKKQAIQFYKGKNCNKKEQNPYIFKSKKSESKRFYVKNDGYYSFRIINISKIGTEVFSECSSPILVDTVALKPAINLKIRNQKGDEIFKIFSAKKILKPHIVNGTWVNTSGKEVYKRHLLFYGDSMCQKNIVQKVKIKPSTKKIKLKIKKLGNYSFQLSDEDKAGNKSYSKCSKSLNIIQMPSLGIAYDLSFDEHSSTNNKNRVINARWKLDKSQSIRTQIIQLYKDELCKDPVAEPIDLNSKMTRTKKFKLDRDGKYAFRIKTFGIKGKMELSKCSASVTVDTQAPLSAKELSFKEYKGDERIFLRYSKKKLSLTAKWKRSPSHDLSYQELYLYGDEKCGKQFGKKVTIKRKEKDAYEYKLPMLGAYSYRVKTFDYTGNSTLSDCSMNVELFLRKTLDKASKVTFEKAPMTTSKSITAVWKKSQAKHLDNQIIRLFYNDKQCSRSMIKEIDLNSKKVERKTIETEEDGLYTFKIVSIGTAGYREESKCSRSVYVDTIRPESASGLTFKNADKNGKYFNYITNKTETKNREIKINAAWKRSTSEDVYSQEISYYSDDKCTIKIRENVKLPSSKSESFVIDAFKSGYYSFKISSLDKNKNRTTTPCSKPIEVIITPHLKPASRLLFDEGEKTNKTRITLRWRNPKTKDFITQKVHLFKGNKCEGSAVDNIDLKSNKAQSFVYQVLEDGAYTFNITSIGGSGAWMVSHCSRPIYVDTTPTLKATNLLFEQGKENFHLTFVKDEDYVKAMWSKSQSKDLENQLISLYSDGECKKIIGESLSLKSNKTESHTFIIPKPGEYSYNIQSVDPLGNIINSDCSKPLNIIFRKPLLNAQKLTFEKSPATNKDVVYAIWNKSISEDLTNQKIQFYNGKSCNTSASRLIDLISTKTERRRLVIDHEGFYTFKILSVGSTGYVNYSDCSESIAYDVTDPKPATNLAFKDLKGKARTRFYFKSLAEERSKSIKINAHWDRSVSKDVTSQKFYLYHDEECDGDIKESTEIKSSLISHTFEAPNVGLYSYKIESRDWANNITTSECSRTLNVEILNRENKATSLSFEEGSLSPRKTITPNWTRSQDKDVKTQLISYYKDDKCGSLIGNEIDITSTQKEKTSYKVDSDGLYSFKITAVNQQGMKQPSECSQPIEVDTTPPKAATELFFKEGGFKKSYLSAYWTPSTSNDVVAQELHLYSDVNCKQKSNKPIKIDNNEKSSYLVYLSGSKFYTFQIVSIDKIKNRTFSECSIPTMRSDGYVPFSLLLDKNEVEQERKEGHVNISDRFAIEYEAGYVWANGLTQKIDLNYNFYSTRLTVHTKPFAFLESVRTRGSFVRAMADLAIGVFYQRGVIDFSEVKDGSGVRAYPQTFGLYLYKYFWNDFLINDLNLGLQSGFEKYALKINAKHRLREVELSNYKFGVLVNYEMPRLLSNLTLDFNHSPSVDYNQDPELLSGTLDKVTITEYSARFLRRVARRVDLGFGYDYEQLRMEISDYRKQYYQLPKESRHRFGLFYMWHYE